MPEAYTPGTTLVVGELDELATNACSKKTLIWIWTALDHFKQGILAWVVGDHSAETFGSLWAIVALWRCSFIVTDRFTLDLFLAATIIVSKTSMTRVEG